nr:hypothetical protein BaRGS_006363 [Batillaria attramentaria]
MARGVDVTKLDMTPEELSGDHGLKYPIIQFTCAEGKTRTISGLKKFGFSVSSSYKRMQHTVANTSSYIEHVSAFFSGRRADFKLHFALDLDPLVQARPVFIRFSRLGMELQWWER